MAQVGESSVILVLAVIQISEAREFRDEFIQSASRYIVIYILLNHTNHCYIELSVKSKNKKCHRTYLYGGPHRTKLFRKIQLQPRFVSVFWFWFRHLGHPDFWQWSLIVFVWLYFGAS
jgi:hypothetical protein